MGFLRRIYSKLLGKSYSINPEVDAKFWTPWRMLYGDEAGIDKPFQAHAWVHAAMDAKATALASVPFNIMTDGDPTTTPDEYFANGQRMSMRERRSVKQKRFARIAHREAPRLTKQSTDQAVTQIETGPFYELFRDVNPLMSPYDLWYSWMISMDDCGEAIWVLEQDSEEWIPGNPPTEIWPQNPNGFEPILDPKTKLIAYWKQSLRDGNGSIIERKLPFEQVIQFKRWNPVNPLRGLSPLSACKMGIKQDWLASLYNESWFRQGASPGGTITSDTRDLGDAQRDQLSVSLNDRHGGAAKAGKWVLLPMGLKATPFESSHKDMEFLEQRKWSREEVAAVFKVPKTILSVYEDINYATSVTAERIFWKNGILPDIRYIEMVLLKRLFAPFTGEREWGVFDLTSVESLGPDLEKVARSLQAFQNYGVPFNQLNEDLELGFQPIEGGDVGFMPSGYVPVLSLDSSFLPDSNDPATPETDPPKPETNPSDDGIEAASFETNRSFSETENPEELGIDELAEKAWKSKPARVRKIHDNMMTKVFGPSEKTYLAKFRNYLFRLRADQLSRIERWLELPHASEKAGDGPISQEAVDAILFSRQKWDDELKRRMKSSYELAMQRSWSETAAELGSDLAFHLQDPRIAEFMGRKLAQLVKVNETMQESIRNQLIQGISGGETIAELQDRIRELFNQASAGRALTIARTESGFAVSGARNILFRQEGIEKKAWSTAKDEHVRDSHRIEGQVRGMDETFSNGLLYPRQIGGAPAEVINCRCIEIAVEAPQGEKP